MESKLLQQQIEEKLISCKEVIIITRVISIAREP